jgi:hypothetical protein
MRTLAALCSLAVLLTAAGLDQARREPDPEKRSGLALDQAAAAMQAARTAYNDGDHAGAASRIREVTEAVQLAWDSLASTRKNPRRSPKWFKRAEAATRDLARHLDAFLRDVDFEDRGLIEPAATFVEDIHARLVVGLTGGNRE